MKSYHVSTVLALLLSSLTLTFACEARSHREAKLKTEALEDSKDMQEQQPGELPNPSVSLKRLYFKVFPKTERETPETCYILPRPDSPPASACESQDPTVALMKQYDVCAGSEVRVAVINDIPCQKALEIASFLHQHLDFKKGETYAAYSDRSDACKLAQCSDNQILQNYCQYYEGKVGASKSGSPVTQEARLDSPEEEAAIGICLKDVYKRQVYDREKAYCT